jgi:hypothetical protein
MSLPLDLFVLVTTVAYVVVGLVVGVRLLLLARRTGGFPELVLGLAESLLAGVVPPMFIVTQVVSGPEALVRCSAFLGHLAYTVGCAVMILFTWRVFRPTEGWARAFLYASLGVLGIGGGLQMANAFLAPGIAELRDPQTTAFLLMEWVSLGGFVWTAIEAFAYHAQLRKRLSLGLVDPVVVNRILLWGVVGVGGIVAAGAPVTASVMGLNVSTDVRTRLVCAFATVISSVAIQLAFLPPAFYLRWVRGAAQPA